VIKVGIGPSTKETTLHHFRDPLLDVVSNDDDVDLLGVIVAGTPQENQDKVFVAQRIAAWVEAMRADGAIVSIDGWGNSNIDFATAIEEIGKRNIPIVGMSFVGTQAQFVVTNEYMDTIVDFNKSQEGIETEVVGENNVTELDAKKALAFLKLKMRNKED
jgi:D-proline reductase (dithiol) PrdE